ncbi:MAG: hypothetical protein ACO1O6_05970 [Bacteroidota bacterium]
MSRITGFLSFFIVFAISFTGYSQKRTFIVDKYISVDLPVKLQKVNQSGIDIILGESPHGIMFITKFENPSHKRIYTPSDLADCYIGAIQGVKNKGQVTTLNEVHIDGAKAILAKYKLIDAYLDSIHVESIFLYFKGSLYSLNYKFKDSENPEAHEEKDQLFLSFAINNNEGHISQLDDLPDNPSSLEHVDSFSLGRMIGKVIFYVGLAVVLLIVFWRKIF